MQIAALYDIHGNVPAMEAALHACRAAGPSAVVIGGDIAAGPMPSDTLDILMALGAWAVPIQGPTDRAIVEAYDLRSAGKTKELAACDPVVAWAAKEITGRHRDFLANLPAFVVLPADGLGDVRFCRADVDPKAGIQEQVDAPGLAERFDGVRERVVVVGGSHRASSRTAGGRRFVDPGSVGLPSEDLPGAYWALFGDEVELQRTEYNVKAATRRIARSGMPGARAYASSFASPQ